MQYNRSEEGADQNKMPRKRRITKHRNPPLTKSENVTVVKQISEQLNAMLTAKMGQAEMLQHNLEKGLGNEQCLRDLLLDFLPRRYGVAKGKIANSGGIMSRHLDVIIYDAINCPTLFIDEHENQILPIEGVFGVIEVKTTLSTKTLADAYQNLGSVFDLGPRIDRPLNNYVTACPPFLHVFAFQDARPIAKVAKQFAELSRTHPVSENCFSYSKKSPGFKECTADHYLVCSVDILGKGCVHHMLNGTIRVDDYGDYTLGMFLFNLLANFTNIEMPVIDVHSYLNWIQVASWRGPDSSLMRRQAAIKAAYNALYLVHGRVPASGNWHDGDKIVVRIKATIGGSDREYHSGIPHDLLPAEMESSAVSQIHDMDASIANGG